MTHPKLIDQVHAAIRVKHYSPRTEEAYWNWIKRFILFHNKRHPNDLSEAEVSAFLFRSSPQPHLCLYRQRSSYFKNRIWMWPSRCAGQMKK
ncbi:MAG TPA: phage integrase N-terminal SAM-like domain-containing protein [Blastocatellia bacterium]|nr:phage integrase N-terminal SAM-like domain-containing protein [Blastocatellia bacterium]